MNSGKAPIFNHLNITLNGLFALRAFGLTKDFKKLFYKICYHTTSKFCSYHIGSRWMHFYNDFLGNIFLVFSIFLAVILMDYLDPLFLSTGLALILIVAMNMVWMMFQLSSNRTFMVSAMRMMQYIKF